MSRTKDALIKPRKRRGRQGNAIKRPITQDSPPSRFTATVILSRGKERRPEYYRYNLSYERLLNMKTWYGVGKDGQIYRYFDDNAGGVHFGTVSKESVPKDVLNQLGVKK
ncbi:hypothetical protein [Paenibacillus sp. FSL W8-0194]|uniref:hypothetical protein n=1 Tax=Paenibacillus sp. FSL W8-0194 TaxID=2921711 RepID=UPI0030DC607F